MTLLSPEAILRRVQSIYEDDYADSLSDVDDEWSSTEEVTLSDFAGRTIVPNAEVLPKVWESPYLQIAPGPIQEVADETYQLYASMFDFTINLVYALKHHDAHLLAIKIARHQQATFDFLNKHPSLDFGDNNRVQPGTLSMTPSLTSAGANAVLIQGLRVSFIFRFMNRGF